MRDRLIALIKEAEQKFSSTGKPVLDIEEYVADYLLEKGFIFQPFKVGEAFWALFMNIYQDMRPTEYFIKEYKVDLIYTHKYGITICGNRVSDGIMNRFEFAELGKTLFLTRAEAERAMAERSNENGE